MTNVSPATVTAEQSLLFDTIESRLALKLDDQRRAEVVRLASDLITSGSVQHLQSLTHYLSTEQTSQPLWQTVIQVVTVGETYFFRDQNQWHALRYTILPRMIQERRAQGQLQLRLWSAGCSTGEEPYSLAILVRELISDFAAWDIHILATDLNKNSLERAQKGQYRPWSFRLETPESVRQRWFVEEDGVYRIDPSIRSMVTFSLNNLASFARSTVDSSIIEMDLIICRNVLIYFDNPTAAEVIHRFHRALRDRSWLVLGASEGMMTTNQGFQAHLFDNATLFQKLPESRPEPVNGPSNIGGLPFSIPVPRTRNGSTPPATSNHNRMSANHNGATTDHGRGAADKLDPMAQALQAANREQWAEALRWLEDAEKYDQLRPEVYYLRGVIELHQAELDKALASLRRAIYCDAKFVLAHYALGEVYQSQGDYKKASSEWKLAQAIVRDLEPEVHVPFSEDLTAEMLLELLKYRLDYLPTKR